MASALIAAKYLYYSESILDAGELCCRKREREFSFYFNGLHCRLQMRFQSERVQRKKVQRRVSR